MSAMKRVADHTEEGRQARAGADQEQWPLRLVGGVVSTTGRGLDLQFLTHFEAIEQPGAHDSASHPFDLDLEIRIEGRDTRQRVAPGDAVESANVGELARLVLYGQKRSKADAGDGLRKVSLGDYPCAGEEVCVVRRLNDQILGRSESARKEIAAVLEFLTEAGLALGLGRTFSLTQQADQADTRSTGRCNFDPASLESF